MSIGRFLGGVGALIWNPDANRYLLLRRAASKDFSAGVWECVTGRVDQGEGFMAALRREVQEELGVSAQPLFFLGTTHFYRGAALPENELIGVVFVCTVADPGAVQISDEHEESRWVTAQEAAALLTAGDPSTRWTRRVIDRAEAVRRRLTPELLAFYRENSFSLG